VGTFFELDQADWRALIYKCCSSQTWRPIARR